MRLKILKMSITLASSFSRPGRSGSFVERDFVFGWALNGKPEGGGGMINSRIVGGIYTGWGGTCTARDERTHSKETTLIASTYVVPNSFEQVWNRVACRSTHASLVQRLCDSYTPQSHNWCRETSPRHFVDTWSSHLPTVRNDRITP